MLEFIILMVVLDLLVKWTMGKPQEEPKAAPCKGDKTKAWVCGNTAEYDFKTLDDAMEYREMRLSGWKGNAIDFYKWKEEE